MRSIDIYFYCFSINSLVFFLYQFDIVFLSIHCCFFYINLILFFYQFNIVLQHNFCFFDTHIEPIVNFPNDEIRLIEIDFKRHEGITCSVGVGPNKLISKIVSGYKNTVRFRTFPLKRAKDYPHLDFGYFCDEKNVQLLSEFLGR